MDTEALRAAQDTLAAALREADPARWGAPTPCTGWDVRALVDHLVTGNERFVVRLSGGTPGDPPDRSGATPLELMRAYERTATEVVEAFERPGVMDEVSQWPIGALQGRDTLGLKITETLTHGWDLAQALGVPIVFDEVTVDEAYAWAGPALARIPEGRNPFGSPQPVPAGAGGLDRLAALLGRKCEGSDPPEGA